MKKNHNADLKEKNVNEERLKMAQRVAHVGSWEYILETKQLWGSDECYSIYGLPAQSGYIHPKELDQYIVDGEIVRFALDNLIKNGSKHDIIYSIRRANDQNLRTLHSVAELIHDADKKPIKVVGVIQDITDRRLAEESIRQSEEKYRKLIERMPDGVYKSTHDGKFLEVNPAMVKILGYSSVEELLSVDIKRDLYFAVEDREKAAMEEKYNEMAVFRMRKKDGSEVWVEDNGRHVLDENGNVLYHEGIMRDITDRKHGELILRRSEEKYRKLIEKMPDGVYKSTHDGRFLEVNPAMVKILGYSSVEELLGVDIKRDLYFEEEDRDSAVLEERHAEMAVFRMRRKDGSEIWVEDNGRIVLDDTGKVLFHEGILRDVTERIKTERALLESERLLRESQRVAHLGSYSLDINTGHWISSPALDEIFGIDQNYTRILETLIAIIHPDYRRTFSNILNDALTKKHRLDAEFKIVRLNDKAERWIHFMGDYEENIHHNIVRLYGTIQDSTESKQLELQLIQSQKLEGLGTLAGGIAHDFNNLMTMLLGNAELLKAKLQPEDSQNKYIDQMIEVAERGASISKQLLLFSRQSEIKLKPLSLTSLINEVQTMLRHFIPKSIQVITEIESENCRILGDAGHIHQILLNLCLNAKDAMGDQGTLTIRESLVSPQFILEKFNRDTEKYFVRIEISDTGTGISPEIIQKIFDPFFTTKEKGKGTGLGLSIVDGLVRSHNGLVDVQSVIGKGTTFSIYFPSEESAEQAVDASVPRKVLDSKCILVVDDEIEIQTILSEFFETLGCEVLRASDGIEGLSVYQSNKHRIHVIISDLGMPNMNGEEFFHEVKKFDPEVRVIISSGYLDHQTRHRMMERGVRDFINKPYKLSEMAKVVETVLQTD